MSLENDPEAILALLKRVSNGLRRRGANAHEAEEAVQQAFLNWWNKGEAKHSIDRLEAWMYQVGWRHFLAMRRQERRRAQIAQDVCRANGKQVMDAPAMLLAEEENDRLKTAIDELPPEFRVLVRRLRRGDNCKRIAEDYGVSAMFVGKLIKKALELLRTILEQEP